MMEQRVLFACREVHVYRVPQQQLVQGRFLCQEWEGEHLFTGRCRVVEEQQGQVWIRLEDRISGELFAESPFHESGPQHAVDSSRYFVLQVMDRETQRKAFLGVGFEQRGEAFDFLASLADAKRQQTTAVELLSEEEQKPVSKDFSLKQGQKLRLSVPGMKKPSSTTQAQVSNKVSRPSNDDMEDWLFQDSSTSEATTIHSENNYSKGQTQPCLDDLLF